MLPLADRELAIQPMACPAQLKPGDMVRPACGKRWHQVIAVSLCVGPDDCMAVHLLRHDPIHLRSFDTIDWRPRR